MNEASPKYNRQSCWCIGKWRWFHFALVVSMLGNFWFACQPLRERVCGSNRKVRIVETDVLLLSRLAGFQPTSIDLTKTRCKVTFKQNSFHSHQLHWGYFDREQAYLLHSIPFQYICNSFDRNFFSWAALENQKLDHFTVDDFRIFPEPNRVTPYLAVRVAESNIVSEFHVTRYSVRERDTSVIEAIQEVPLAHPLEVHECEFSIGSQGEFELRDEHIQEFEWALIPASVLGVGNRLSNEALLSSSSLSESHVGYYLLPLRVDIWPPYAEYHQIEVEHEQK